MTINQNVSVNEVQAKFREEYSHLDMKFYKKSHEEFQGSQMVYEVKGNELLGTLNPNVQTGEIDISSYVTVTELETAFEEAFGLHIQIFRKSGNTWLQTTMTDHWTLKHHQEKAIEMDKYTENRRAV